MYHLTGEGESLIPADYEDMTNTILLLELLVGEEPRVAQQPAERRARRSGVVVHAAAHLALLGRRRRVFGHLEAGDRISHLHIGVGAASAFLEAREPVGEVERCTTSRGRVNPPFLSTMRT